MTLDDAERKKATSDPLGAQASLLSVPVRRSSESVEPAHDTTPANGPEDILAYWDWLRRGRDYPSPIDLDAKKIAYHWPYSFLMRCTTDGRLLEIGRVFSPEAQTGGVLKGGNPFTDDDTSMITVWILDIAHKARRKGMPVEEIEVLSLPNGPRSYRGLALPLSETPRRVDHVLCYVQSIG